MPSLKATVLTVNRRTIMVKLNNPEAATLAFTAVSIAGCAVFSRETNPITGEVVFELKKEGDASSFASGSECEVTLDETRFAKLAEDEIENVNDEKTFLVFLEVLADDKRFNPVEWSYHDIADHLEGCIKWAKLSEEGKAEDYEVPANPWKRFADLLLYGGKWSE
jgi:hypothetical protein